MTGHMDTVNISNGVNLNIIFDERFKTSRITVNILIPLDKKHVSSNAVLPYVLCRSCMAHKDYFMLNKKLARLYGAALYADVRKIGDVQILSLSIAGLNDEYSIEEEFISEELSNLICEVVFNPNVESMSFLKHEVESQKRQIIDVIDSELNDKRTYARLRCVELMCEGEAYSINRFGNKKDIESLSGADIYNAWLRAIENARIEIMVMGSGYSKEAINKLKNSFESVKRKNVIDCKTKIINRADSKKEYKEAIDIAQAKLVIGFRSGKSENFHEMLSKRLMTDIFGGTPHSKLFLNVREKLSLCYYCSAIYNNNKEIILVQSGVEPENIYRAKEEILKQMQAMKSGDFTQEDIDIAKLSCINDFLTTSDSLSALEQFYLAQVFEDKIYSPVEFGDIMQNIDKKDIVNAANKVSVDTVYILTNSREDS